MSQGKRIITPQQDADKEVPEDGVDIHFAVLRCWLHATQTDIGKIARLTKRKLGVVGGKEEEKGEEVRNALNFCRNSSFRFTHKRLNVS